MSYIGNPIISTDFPKDTFSGTGSTTAFTMSIAPASVNAVIVIVSGVTQDPSTYTISGTTLTFSAAPPSGTNNISIRHLGVAGIPNVPADASVTTAKLATQTSIPFATGSIGAGNASIMKNRIINGAMVIDQRNAGASVTLPSGDAFVVDRYNIYCTQSSKLTGQQNAGSVTPPDGFRNYLGLTSTSAYSVSSGDIFTLFQNIEGYNVADLGWGTANAKTVTLSFWVRSSLTGSFGGSLLNGAQNRAYPFSYTISSANTWEQKSITVAGDTTGTWLTTDGRGLIVGLGLGNGSTFSGTAGAWTAGQIYSPTGSTSIVGTNGATFYITGVQLEVGSSATGFEYVNYQTSLANCQRYYYRISPNGAGLTLGTGLCVSTSTADSYTNLPVTMRIAPTALEQTGTASDYLVRSNGSVDTTCTSVPTFLTATTLGAMTRFTTGATLTQAQASFNRTNSTSAYLGWSAEL